MRKVYKYRCAKKPTHLHQRIRLACVCLELNILEELVFIQAGLSLCTLTRREVNRFNERQRRAAVDLCDGETSGLAVVAHCRCSLNTTLGLPQHTGAMGRVFVAYQITPAEGSVSIDGSCIKSVALASTLSVDCDNYRR